MAMTDLSKRAKSIALASGADLVGIVKTADMPEHAGKHSLGSYPKPET